MLKRFYEEGKERLAGAEGIALVLPLHKDSGAQPMGGRASATRRTHFRIWLQTPIGHSAAEFSLAPPSPAPFQIPRTRIIFMNSTTMLHAAPPHCRLPIGLVLRADYALIAQSIAQSSIVQLLDHNTAWVAPRLDPVGRSP